MDERALLETLAAGPTSGADLARATGLTRAAVWKRIEALREAGVEIQARPGEGYALARPTQLLDSEAIAAALAPEVRARITSIDVAWSIDSSNSELLRQQPAADGMTDVLLAERQTGGRGRRGRNWASPLAAHLYLSVSRTFAGGLVRLGGLSLVAGIAAVEALHAQGFTQVRLKWPNDLVVPDGDVLRKLGGVLVEGGGEHAGPVRAVIGLGLNVSMPSATGATIDQPWCDLAQLSPASDPPLRNRIAASMLDRWLPALDEFDAAGLAPFLGRYAALDALKMRAVALHEGTVRTAVALGLAADGALRVRTADGREHSVHSGEVSVRCVAGSPA
ncbi:MAG: biotin--[acetyl-CoA-carboxylase] ligase [Pseudomonadota bacterium]|nr:biotin--[acetyl-CoA-carboxylase] ligase [Pseudomonadota bacterium]